MDNLESFFETRDDSLWSYMENTIWKMGMENEEYNKLCDEIEQLLNRHPNLRTVLEDERITELSLEDAKALIELKTLYLNQRDIEMENLFYLGGKNLYYYLKKIRVIDNEK